MTLKEWIELTPEERNRERRTWPRDADGGYWSDLLSEARDRFEEQFGDHPLINYIGTSAWHASGYEPSIIVTTALWTPQRIEELPDRYLTLAVTQKPIEDNKDYYLRTWKLVLGELLGWSPEQVREWARAHHEDDLNGNGSFFYHEDAVDHIVWLLVPDQLRERLVGLPRVELKQKLIAAIAHYGSQPLWDAPYDWQAAKARIEATISEYEKLG